MAPTISVVVAALDEEQHLGPTLLSAGDGCGVERIVVDGGSRDATAAVARAHGATVLHDAAGRGAQLNTGAAAASGAILLFLHADTLLPVGWGAAVRRALADSNAMLGAFRFQTDSPSLPMAVVERLARFRSSWLGLPYGDQGLFMWAHSFRGLGGFAEQPLLDDLDLVVRARRAGPIVTLPMPAVTSARRWRRHGVLRTTLVNQAVLAGWALGVDPARLASWYRRT